MSGEQSQVVFNIHAFTNIGENIHVVGNIPELGNWDPNESTEAFHTPEYPYWFLPVSVPTKSTFEYKFIKKDANGQVVWESGVNRIFTSPTKTNGVLFTPVHYWNY